MHGARLTWTDRWTVPAYCLPTRLQPSARVMRQAHEHLQHHATPACQPLVRICLTLQRFLGVPNTVHIAGDAQHRHFPARRPKGYRDEGPLEGTGWESRPTIVSTKSSLRQRGLPRGYITQLHPTVKHHSKVHRAHKNATDTARFLIQLSTSAAQHWHSDLHHRPALLSVAPCCPIAVSPNHTCLYLEQAHIA